MSMVAPKERKYLCADALFRLVRSGFANIADDRYGDAEISLTDTLMSAFAMFSLKSPSLLAFDKERAEGNLATIYGIERVPCDTHMRERLDPVSPASLRPSFTSVFRQLQRGKVLEEMMFLDGYYLWFCRKFSFAAICGMVSPPDPWCKGGERRWRSASRGPIFRRKSFSWACAGMWRIL
jgi:hypothetical protein